MALFKRLRNAFKGMTPATAAPPKPTLENPLSELQVLVGHQDIVRVIVGIDGERFATGADDGLVLIWHYETGRILFTLAAHGRPVTALLASEFEGVLVSASMDCSVRIWNLDKGDCLHSYTYHKGKVQCLSFLYGDTSRFVSAGNDDALWVWKTHSSTEPQMIAREQSDNVLCMLAVPNERVLVGSVNSPDVAVYSAKTYKLIGRLQGHHVDGVRCLTLINSNTFASAASDGVIIIWDISGMCPAYFLNNKYEEGEGGAQPAEPDYAFHREQANCAVTCLLALNPYYLAACMGAGFVVYEVASGQSVVENKHAHENRCICNAIVAVADGPFLITAASDATIRVWECERGEGRGDDVDEFRFLRGSTGRLPALVGELVGHSDSVNAMVNCTEGSVASVGSDGLVLLWKRGMLQKEMRSHLASLALLQSSSTAVYNENPHYEQVSRVGYDGEPPLTPPRAGLGAALDADRRAVFSPRSELALNASPVSEFDGEEEDMNVTEGDMNPGDHLRIKMYDSPASSIVPFATPEVGHSEDPVLREEEHSPPISHYATPHAATREVETRSTPQTKANNVVVIGSEGGGVRGVDTQGDVVPSPFSVGYVSACNSPASSDGGFDDDDDRRVEELIAQQAVAPHVDKGSASGAASGGSALALTKNTEASVGGDAVGVSDVGGGSGTGSGGKGGSSKGNKKDKRRSKTDKLKAF